MFSSDPPQSKPSVLNWNKACSLPTWRSKPSSEVAFSPPSHDPFEPHLRCQTRLFYVLTCHKRLAWIQSLVRSTLTGRGVVTLGQNSHQKYPEVRLAPAWPRRIYLRSRAPREYKNVFRPDNLFGKAVSRYRWPIDTNAQLLFISLVPLTDKACWR